MLGLGVHLILHFIIVFACVIDTQAHSGVFLLKCFVILKMVMMGMKACWLIFKVSDLPAGSHDCSGCVEMCL